MPKPIKEALFECVGEIANAFAIACYKQNRFIGFSQTELDSGAWVEEMTEWMLVSFEEFDQDSDDHETALDAIRALVYRLFENTEALVADKLNP